MDITDIYQTLHSKIQNISSSTYGSFTKVDYIRDYKTSFNRNQNNTRLTFSDNITKN